MELEKSKSLIELDKERLSDKEQDNRAGDIEVFYTSHFEKVLDLKELEWLRSMGETDWTKEPKEHAIWHQGALACLKEMKEWFEEQVRISQSRFETEDKPKAGEVIASVDE